MIIKSSEFDKQLAIDILEITINKSFPYRLKGSYSRKGTGAPVSDIDYTAKVYYNSGLLRRIVQILKNIEKSKKFMFIQFWCGNYSEFNPPWIIDDEGSCKYSHPETTKWYKQLKGLIPDSTYTEVDILLNGPTSSLKKLLDVQSLIFPWAEIQWRLPDIQRGYIDKRGIRYDLLQLMKSQPSVLEFVYTPRPDGYEICGIDIGLDDSKYPKGLPDVMHKYYSGDVYSIFKSYQKRLHPDALPLYKSVQKVIEPLVAVRYQLEMLKIVKNFRPQRPQFEHALEDDSNKYLANLQFVETIPDTEVQDVIAIVTSKIQEAVTPIIPMYSEVLKPEYIQRISMNLHRGEEAQTEIEKDEFLRRVQDNWTCPFFSTNISDFKILSWLSVRSLIPISKLVNCYIKVSSKLNKTVESLISETINQNLLSIKIVGDELELYEDRQLLYKYQVSDLEQLQSYIFIG